MPDVAASIKMPYPVSYPITINAGTIRIASTTPSIRIMGNKSFVPACSPCFLAALILALTACSACFANLVRALYASGYGDNIDISIGQGFQGKTFEGLGVGRCCKGASHCVMGCPPTAEAIANALEDLAWQG